jgi:hypothetical protein
MKRTALKLPSPPAIYRGDGTQDSSLKTCLKRIATFWRPSNCSDEPPVATVSRFAQHLVDESTGAPHTPADLTARAVAASLIDPDLALYLPYDGHPADFDDADSVAAVPMAVDYTASGENKLHLVAKTAGVLSPAPQLIITAANALPAGANATLGIVTQAAGVVTVRPKTTAGSKATCSLATSGTAMTVTHHTAGPELNGKLITRTVATTPTAIGSFVTPSAPLVASMADGEIGIALATGVGTSGTLALEESSAGLGKLTIKQKAAYRGAWGNTKIKAQVVVAGVGTAFSVTATLYPLVNPTELQITVNLATTSEGVAIAVADAGLVAYINTALEAVTIVDGVYDFTDALLAEVVSDTKTFDSPQTWVAMSGGVDAAPDNTANAVAFVKTALELLSPDEGVTFVDVTADGTGYLAGAGSNAFAAGGSNSIIDSDIDALKALLNTAGSTIINATTVTGDGATKITATSAPGHITLTGGADATYDPEHLGTPARAGRIATDGADVWTAMKEDLTGTSTGVWVKTYTHTD